MRFTDESGASFDVQVVTNHSHGRLRVGDAVTMIYPRGEPYRAKVYDFSHYWLLWILLALGGAFPLLIGLAR